MIYISTLKEEDGSFSFYRMPIPVDILKFESMSGMVSLQLNKGEEIFTVYHDDYLSPDDVKQLVNVWGNCDVKSLSIVLIDGLD